MVFNRGGAKQPTAKQAAAAAQARAKAHHAMHHHKGDHHAAVPLSSAAISTLPAENGPISVLLPGTHHLLNSHLVRVEAGGREIVITAPRHSGEEVMADTGDGLLLVWTSAKGLHRVATEFVSGREEKGVPAWRLQVEGPVAVRERRRHARVHLSGRFQIKCGEQKISAYLVDVSEGGMQCVVADAKPIIANNGKFDAPLILADEQSKQKVKVDIKGAVTWKSFSGKNTHLGVVFEHMHHKEAEKFRHLIQTMVKRGSPVAAGKVAARTLPVAAVPVPTNSNGAIGARRAPLKGKH